MPKKPKLTIVKIPLTYKPQFKPVNFKPYPQLYLELLENKDKVRPDLRDKYYEPKVVDDTHTLNNEDVDKVDTIIRKEVQEMDPDNVYVSQINWDRPINYSQSSSISSPSITNSSSVSSVVSHPFGDMHPEFAEEPKDLTQVRFDTPYRVEREKSDSPHRTDTVKSIQESKPALRSSFARKPVSFTPTKNMSDSEPSSNTNSNTSSNDKVSYRDLALRAAAKAYSFPEVSTEDYHVEEYVPPSATQFIPSTVAPIAEENPHEEDLSDPIARILMGAANEEKQPIYSGPSSSQSGHTIQQPAQNAQPSQQTSQAAPQQPKSSTANPPSLADINRGQTHPGQIYMGGSSQSGEEEMQKKREILFKLKQLKTYYKDVNIPEFSEYTPLSIMESEYNMFYKQLQLDSRVENYKKFLMFGFAIVEFVVQKLLKFEEMSGFTVQQLTNMNQYEKILLEIGEKRKFEPEKGLAPELKLIGIIFINAAMFIGMKMLFKGGGNAILESIGQNGNSASSAPKPPTTNLGGDSAPKRKMQGPDINLDDL
jgi:hypothetical protein